MTAPFSTTIRPTLVLIAACATAPNLASGAVLSPRASCDPSTGCFLDLGQWVSALGVEFDQIPMLHLDAAGVADSFEIDSPPTINNTPLCPPPDRCRLHWFAEDTQLPNSLRLVPLQFGGGASPTAYGMTWNDEEGTEIPHFQNAISIGDIDNWEDDDFSIEFLDGPPVHAFGFQVHDNSGEVGEELRLYGPGDQVVAIYDMDQLNSNGTSGFVGFLVDEPVIRVEFHEGSGGDDIALGKIFIAPPSDRDRQTLRLPFPEASGFGDEVALSDGWLAVLDDSFQSPSLRLHTRSDEGLWRERQVLPLEGFIADIALDGDTLAVARIVGETGSIDIYRLAADTWSFDQTLEPLGSRGQVAIGTDLGLEGDLLVSGGHQMATVYRRSAGIWQPLNHLVPEPAVDSIDSVALDGDRIAAGQTGRGPSRPGSVTLFERIGPENWVQVDRVASPDPPVEFEDDFFAHTISLRGDRLLVGAPAYVGEDYDYSGRTYLYERTPQGNWSFDDHLGDDLPFEERRLGSSVLITDNGRIFVGAEEAEDLDDYAGNVWEMIETTSEQGVSNWSSIAVPIHDAERLERWGADLAWDDHTLAIGSGSRRAYVLRYSQIYSDGFESGDTTTWSVTTP